MKSKDKLTKTRVFRSDLGQVSRIPDLLKWPEGEAYMTQPHDGLFNSTLRNRWDLFFAEPGAEFHFDSEELRDDTSPRDVTLSMQGDSALLRSCKARKS